MTPSHQADVQIRNRLGMHARPAAQFVRLAGQFGADITVSRNGIDVDGKSIMGVMMLAAEQGATLRVRAEGDDAAEAVAALVALLERRFDEDDDGRPRRPENGS